jgi:hypothetical protein
MQRPFAVIVKLLGSFHRMKNIYWCHTLLRVWKVETTKTAFEIRRRDPDLCYFGFVVVVRVPRRSSGLISCPVTHSIDLPFRN